MLNCLEYDDSSLPLGMPSPGDIWRVAKVGRIREPKRLEHGNCQRLRADPRNAYNGGAQCEHDDDGLADHGFSIFVPHSGQTPETLPVRL